MDASEALPVVLRRWWRLAVLHHAQSEHRKVFLPLVHVGIPGRIEAIHPVREDEPTDHTLRTDIVAAMVRRTSQDQQPTPVVWLTRRGPLDPAQDLDLAWFAAARSAYAEAGLPLRMVVVDRHGWRDPESGASVSWKRIRQR